MESVLELAVDKKRVSKHVQKLQEVVETVGKSQQDAIDSHMKAAAQRLEIKPVKLEWSKPEKQAAKIVPKPTNLVTQNGYRGYSDLIDKVPEEEKKNYPYSRTGLSNSRELTLLINGKNSVLDIKNMLDVQHARSSDLQSVINYIEILKSAGLVVY